MELLLFIIVSIGITNIIQNESIFASIRKHLNVFAPKIYKFIICPTCFGFWIGVLLSQVMILYSNDQTLNIFICGVVSSISNKVFAMLNTDDFAEI